MIYEIKDSLGALATAHYLESKAESMGTKHNDQPMGEARVRLKVLIAGDLIPSIV